MHTQLGYRGDPVELRPNTHPTMPKVVIRDPHGKLLEDTHFDASEGLIVALDNYPAVGQVAIVAPGGTQSLILP
jgi:hypothetical protein